MSVTSLIQRPDAGGSKGQRVSIRTNMFPIRITKKTSRDLYLFDVAIEKMTARPRAGTEVRKNPMDQRFNRELVTLVIAREKLFPLYAYDGKSLLYAMSKPPDKSYQLEHNDPSNRPCTFSIKFTCAKTISIASLVSFIESGAPLPEREALAAFDVFSKNNAVLGDFIPIRDTVYKPVGIGSLGGGLEAREGFFTSTRATQAGLLLNVNLDTGAFYESKPLLEVVTRLFRIKDAYQLGKTVLGPNDVADLNRTLRGVYISMKHASKKILVDGVSTKSANESFFEVENERISVTQYFKKQYNIDLKFGNLPCVSKGRSLFPLEFCSISADQFVRRKLNPEQTAKMIEFAGIKPHERMKRIADGVNELQLSKNPFLTELGLVQDSNMMRIESRIVPPAKIRYNKEIQVQNGSWNLRDIALLKPLRVNNWVVLATTRCDINMAKDFVENLKRSGRNMGLQFENPRNFYACGSGEAQIAQKIAEIVQSQPIQLLFAIVDGSSSSYRAVKRASDSTHGFASQCVVASNLKKGKSPQFISNIVIKINSKIGGINLRLASAIPKVTSNTMLLGADITHPTGGGRMESRPSIAAVVGSYDEAFANYNTVVRQQSTRVERIQDMKGIVKELLMRYQRVNNRFPENLFFVRDGISETELQDSYIYEANAIKAACFEISPNFKPPLTFIVAQKRTRVRFFPESREQADRSGNIKAGTVVDARIVDPRNFDFYMQSHSGLQGTTVPVHYFVIQDDNRFSSDDIQVVLDGLCNLNARSTKTGSLTVPALYAHLAAGRGRLLSKVDMDTSDVASVRSGISVGMHEVNVGMSDKNFFL